MLKFNIWIERLRPLPAKELSFQGLEAKDMRQAHGFSRTKAYKNKEFATPAPEEIHIWGEEFVAPKPKQGNLFEE